MAGFSRPPGQLRAQRALCTGRGSPRLYFRHRAHVGRPSSPATLRPALHSFLCPPHPVAAGDMAGPPRWLAPPQQASALCRTGWSVCLSELQSGSSLSPACHVPQGRAIITLVEETGLREAN